MDASHHFHYELFVPNIYENIDDDAKNKDHNISDNHFNSSSEWLAGEQMEKFFSWAENKTGELIHTINDRSGRKSTVYWKCTNE